MGDEIVRSGAVAITAGSWSEAQAMAQTLAQAKGFVPRALAGDKHAVLAAILTGAELGLGPMQSLRSIHVVDGKPMLSADLMLALAIRGGVRPQWLESTATIARLRLTRDGFEPHEQRFTLDEAKAAGLAGKDNWRKYPSAMLRARCLSAALRAFCPDVLGAGVYVEGEIEERAPHAVHHEPEPPTDAAIVEEQPERPQTRLDECQTADELRAWCEDCAEMVREHGAKGLARVVGHADRIGVQRGDVLRWLGHELAPEDEAA